MICYSILLIALASVAPGKFESQIVHGIDAELDEYPFQISLERLGYHTCGGTILNNQWILTAAHCVFGDTPKDVSIRAGTMDIDDGSGQLVDVARIVIHGSYNSRNQYINDIAVLKLAKHLTLDHNVKPVKLPRSMEHTPAGTPATVIGWGFPYTGGSVMRYLQTVNITVYSDNACSMAYPGKTYASNICAGVPEGGKGQCSGDSGGPLMANDHQIGIVSWSKKPCTMKGYPGVFTEVSHYVDWIYEQIRN